MLENIVKEPSSSKGASDEKLKGCVFTSTESHEK